MTPPSLPRDRPRREPRSPEGRHRKRALRPALDGLEGRLLLAVGTGTTLTASTTAPVIGQPVTLTADVSTLAPEPFARDRQPSPSTTARPASESGRSRRSAG